MAERRWRLCSWEWGWEDAPYLRVEFDDGEKNTLEISTLYDDYSDDLACVAEDPESYLPKQWFRLMEEACEDCQEALGDMAYDDKWHFEDVDNPCRWRPQVELEALHEHAKTHTLFGLPE